MSLYSLMAVLHSSGGKQASSLRGRVQSDHRLFVAVKFKACNENLLKILSWKLSISVESKNMFFFVGQRFSINPTYR